ncbi:hypothetical protein Tco_1220428 [Tanacetum coccineum]
MGKELERGNFPDSLLRMVFYFECLSKKSVDEGFRMPKRGQHEEWMLEDQRNIVILGLVITASLSKVSVLLVHEDVPLCHFCEYSAIYWMAVLVVAVFEVQQKEDGIFISHDKYVADILKKSDFVTMKTTSTPIETNKALIKDEEAEDVDVHLYRSMIGSFMYLIASRPDIMFVVYACARFQVTPKVSHLYVVKRIFRY